MNHQGAHARAPSAAPSLAVGTNGVAPRPRVVAADDLWLSPCQGRPCLAIHFTWRPQRPAVSVLLPRIEDALAPFEARPHWAKLFTLAPDCLRALYPRLPDFRGVKGRGL